MDPQTEARFLHIWYTLMQIVFTAAPAIYLLLSRSSIHVCRHRITLPFLTSLAALCLVNEAHNLARPVYVCFYPVKGETYHHPEESRLKVQWVLDLLAAVLAAAALVNNLAEKIVLGDSGTIEVGAEERRDEKRSDLSNTARGITMYEETRKKRLERRWRSGLAGNVLMIGSWVVGMGGYYTMLGRSKEGKFGFY